MIPIAGIASSLLGAKPAGHDDACAAGIRRTVPFHWSQSVCLSPLPPWVSEQEQVRVWSVTVRVRSIDAGTCYGVPRTAQGRVAVYSFHLDDKPDADLSDYDDIDEAFAEGGLPGDIADEFRARSGQVIFRDI